MITAAISLLFAVVSPAAMASETFEASFEISTLQVADDNFDLFSSRGAIVTPGLRLGVAVHERVTLVAGWHHGRTGGELRGPSDEFLLHTALFTHQYSLGVKATLPVDYVVVPYATLQGTLFHAVARFDDAPRVWDSPGQLTRVGLAPGGSLTGGAEINIPVDWAAKPKLHIEAGYGLFSGANFEDIGSLRPGGYTIRAGMGASF
jgi:hypothetical protein